MGAAKQEPAGESAEGGTVQAGGQEQDQTPTPNKASNDRVHLHVNSTL